MAKTTKATTRKPSKSLALKGKDSIQKIHTEVAQVDVTPDNMIMIALQGGRTMEEIGKLIEFRNNELARLAELDFRSAKTRFTKERKRIIKTNEANFGVTNSGKQGAKYKYENLDDVDVTIKDLAADCGFSWDWKTRYENKFVYIKCILSHKSGHSESDEMRGEPDTSGGKNPMQADSSTCTYLERQTLKKVLGLSAGNDNDGHSIKGNPVDNVDQEDQQIWSRLHNPTDAQYNELMRNIIQGKETVDNAMLQFSLSEQREKALRIAEESRNKQTPNP